MAETDSTAQQKALETKSAVGVIHQEDTAAYRLKLETRDMGLNLYASIHPKGKGNAVEPKTIIDLLQSLEITAKFNHKNITDMCSAASLGRPVENCLLATGHPPEHGVDGHIDFLIQPTQLDSEYETDADGRVDYHHRKLFENANKGDVVGILRPPTLGKSGLTVRGKPIAPNPGKELENIPQGGEHVSTMLQEGKHCFVAGISGRVVFENNTISITDYLEIDGDIDYSFGSLDFVGSILIKGDVLDGFDVKAGKDLTVNGTIGECEIRAKRDVTIGGITAKNNGLISCGGTVRAHYIDRCKVECGQDVIVDNEVVNCDIKCNGMLSVPNGTILSGNYIALKGVEAKHIGSEGGVTTNIICGVSFTADEALEPLLEQLDPLGKEIEKLSKKLQPYLDDPNLLKRAFPSERQHISEWSNDLKELTPKRDALKAKIHKIREAVAERANPMVNVNNSIGEGVNIMLFGCRFPILKEHVGSLTIIKNSRKDELRFIPLQQMKRGAKKIEEEIVAKELEEERKYDELDEADGDD